MFGAILINMNQEDNLQPSFFFKESSPFHCHNFKCAQNDKTTHLFLAQENQPPRTEQYLEGQPYRASSFFFTPTSPKHIHFDVNNSYNTKFEFKTPMTEVSISKKIRFSDSEESECQNEGLSPKRKGFRQKKSSSNRIIRNVKGLRSLSEYVYTIVSQLGKTKYKAVAERLIEDISKNGVLYDKVKDQHNIKRRVYDALNVFIAAGMLQKQGKEVVCNQPYERGRRKLADSGNSRQMIEKQKLQLQIQKKCDAIYQKRLLLEKISQKKQNLVKIIQRNKRESSLQKLQKSILTFPLITTFYEEQKAQILHHNPNVVIFRFPQVPILQGDVDLLLNFKQDQLIPQALSPENIYNVIGKQEDYQPQLRNQINLQPQANDLRDSQIEDI